VLVLKDLDDDDGLRAARGIWNGLVLGAALWIIGFGIYILAAIN